MGDRKAKAFNPCARLENGQIPATPNCALDRQTPPRVAAPDLAPPKFSRLRKIYGTFVIDRAGVYDFGHELLEWAGKGECKTSKNALPAIEVRSSNVTIKNLGVYGAPGGIHIYGSQVKLENVTGWSCGRMVSVFDTANQVSIKNSRFFGHPEYYDFLVSFGVGDFQVENSTFSNAEVCLHFGGGQEGQVKNSKFVGCQASMYAYTLNNRRYSALQSQGNRSWNGSALFYLVGNVRVTSEADLVYDGVRKHLDQNAEISETE